MCGIVGYFGRAANSLTRVLTAMSAIIYRAPDSTGIGVFGDENETVRARKTTGSVIQLVELLLENPLYPNLPQELMGFFDAMGDKSQLEDRQLRLLIFENLPTTYFLDLKKGKMTYPLFSELCDISNVDSRSIVPGWPGRPTPLPSPVIESQKDLRQVVFDLIQEYDLSTVVIKSLIRTALSQTIERRKKEGYLEVESSDILIAFDQIYEEILLEEKVPQPSDIELDSLWEKQKAFSYLWRFLRTSRIKIPIDYDTDGVRCIFRLLDAVLLSRLPMRPHLGEALQHQFETLWPRALKISPLDWKTLYFAEKGANLYGWAAATALTFLEKEMRGFSTPIEADSIEAQMGYYLVPGKTNPIALSSLLPPIVSQGRWALQSAVTTKNAHPFFDHLFQRIIVLNGQFNTNVEADIRSFLEKIANYSFRSENSSEYFALLWGFYYKRLSDEKKRFKSIRTQIENGLEAYDIGSQAVDYHIFHRLRGKSPEQIDELAFIEAARKLTQGGGQIAVCGLSLHSTRTMLVASHNRPVFIVKSIQTNDVMVVSDINAAMGLFSQKSINKITKKLISNNLKHHEVLNELERQKASNQLKNDEIHRYKEEESLLLKNFTVEVYPLEGKELFAKISASIENNQLQRTICITDFDGNPVPDIEPFETILSPPQIQKDFYTSFYETHLNEIPDRLSELLSFYVSDSQNLPCLNIRKGMLQRRFGHNFSRLKSIVLVGMGSANNMNHAARFFIRNVLPGMDVTVITPVEVENILKVISPEKDLVILSSWSGTTADMVQFANHLKSFNIPFIAVTEKLFSDLGLIAERSGGVLSTLSGEEITVSGIKSTMCMLCCLCLLVIWLSSRISGPKNASVFLEELRNIPNILLQLLKDDNVKKFCERISAESARSCAAFVIDALKSTGVGREAAAKLEECSWSSLAKPLDFNDFYIQCLRKDLQYNLVVVNATHKPRLSEALSIMNRLYLEKIPFVAVSTSIRELADVEIFSQNRCICLPSASPALQPFIDFVFFYLLSFHYGRAHGRSSDFPRNRAKSVTAGRSFLSLPSSPSKEFHQLDYKVGGIRLEEKVSDSWLLQETIWETTSENYWEKNYFRQIRRLIRTIQEKDSLECLVHTLAGNNIVYIVHQIADALAEENEIIFLPFDKPANAAAKNLCVQLNRLLLSSFRTAGPLDSTESVPEQSLIFLLDSKSHDIASIETYGKNLPSGCIYVGPEADTSRLNHPAGCCFFKEPFAFCESDLLYITLFLLFIEAIRQLTPARAQILENVLKKGCLGLKNVLENAALKNAIHDSITANSGYLSSFFIGPIGGTGELWTDRFDQFSRMILQNYYYGESAHGPLVTIDPRVYDKYVRLDPRNKMVPKYGEDYVDALEKKYLNGRSTDVFLNQSPNYLFYHSETPFFAEGSWYFPVLRKDYDTTEDNLVILDATSERYMAQANDEMSTFGARYARMIVISQESFFHNKQQISLFKYPISHLLLLPPLFEHKETLFPIPDLILPIAMSMMSMAMTGATQKLTNWAI